MMEKLLRALGLGQLLLALAWGLAWWAQDEDGIALAGVAAVVLFQPALLLVEFVLQRFVNRDDPAPPPSAREWLGAWWAEVFANWRAFVWRQAWRVHAHADQLPHSAGRRGLVLVHGFYCNRAIWNPWLARLREANVAHIAVTLEPAFGHIDDYTTTIDEAVRVVTAATGCAPVLVGHSMGGLAIRAWWRALGDDERVHSVITLGTPHGGTWLARFARALNSCQMRLGSGWLEALRAGEPATRAYRFTCYYSHCDNIVFPARSATLVGADNRHLRGTGHVDMIEHPQVFEEVMRRLA